MKKMLHLIWNFAIAVIKFQNPKLGCNKHFVWQDYNKKQYFAYLLLESYA